MRGVALRGDRARRRRHRRSARRAARERPTTRCWQQSRALAAEMLRHRHDDVRVQVRLRALARRRAAGAAAGGGLGPQVAQTDDVDGAAGARRPRRVHRRLAGWTRSRRCCPRCVAGGGVTALDIFVESIAFSNEHLDADGRAGGSRGLALRAHVEQLSTHALGAGARSRRAPARSTTSRAACHDDIAPLAARRLRRGAAARRRVPRRRAARARRGRCSTPARSCVLATDAQPWHLAGRCRCRSWSGSAVRRYDWSITLETLAAVTLNAAWTLGPRRTTRLDRGRQARRPAAARRARSSHIAYRLRPQPGARSSVIGGEPVYVRDRRRRWRVSVG